MARKKKHAHGGHGWFVTFADLMGLLMSFFVVVAAFSTQDKAKLMAVIGSMQEAFGSSKNSELTGIIEVDGLPVRSHLEHVTAKPENEAHPAPRVLDDEGGAGKSQGEGNAAMGLPSSSIQLKESERQDPHFATAAATLRQALQDMPDFAEISRHIIMEETDEGLNVRIVDQDGRAMFTEGSAQPTETFRELLLRLAPALAQMPNPITITGHTSRGQTQYNSEEAWKLSATRALTVQEILSYGGVNGDQFFAVTGKADSEPLFINEPYLAGNRRVEILLMRTAPALPQ